MVEFHYFAGDGGFEGAVVVFFLAEGGKLALGCLFDGWLRRELSWRGGIQGRSGRVAFPRVNCVLVG